MMNPAAQDLQVSWCLQAVANHTTSGVVFPSGMCFQAMPVSQQQGLPEGHWRQPPGLRLCL